MQSQSAVRAILADHPGTWGARLALVVLVGLAGCGGAQPDPTSEVTDSGSSGMAGMAGMAGAPEPELPAGDLAPLVYGLYDGGDLYFVHTESSDPDVAQMLTEMMGPDVIVVPELAAAPEELAGRVFVFTNGVTGPGPFGFQPDVFDSIPGQAAYRPLRWVHLVTWSDAASPERLSSTDAIEARLDAGDITVEDSGIVVNMPVLIWPGGHR